MRIAGQGDVAFARRQLIERVSDTCHGFAQLIDRIAQIQTQRRQHLIVARAAEMHAAASRADARGEPLFERGLAIFVGELDFPRAGRMLRADRFEPVADGHEV